MPTLYRFIPPVIGTNASWAMRRILLGPSYGFCTCDTLLPLKYVGFSHCFRTEAGAAALKVGRCCTVPWCWCYVDKSMEHDRGCCFYWLCFEDSRLMKEKTTSGFHATLTEPVDGLGRGGQIRELELKLHPNLKEPLKKLSDDPKKREIVEGISIKILVLLRKQILLLALLKPVLSSRKGKGTMEMLRLWVNCNQGI